MNKRNVLLIVVDQWRADHVPHLGATHLKTPNLDRLCRAGVSFRNHVTTCVPCGPARASLHTGLYLMNHRQVQNWIPLDARHTTLPRAIRACGLDPALIGYTTTVPDPRTTHPNDPRFQNLGDMMEGWRPVGAFGPGHEAYFGWLAQKGFPLPANRDEIWLPEGEDAIPGATNRPARIPKELSDSTFFTEKALEYLKGRNGSPFFLHLGYYRPHPPFVVSAPYHAMYRPEDMPKPVLAPSAEAEAAQHPLLAHYLRHSRQASFFTGGQGMIAQMDEATIAQMRATYCGMIAEVDDNIGRVLDHLEATGQMANTLIIFTSDHGEQLGDHHLAGKLGYHDESFRIPLIIVDPDAPNQAGRIENAPTESIDLMPTMIDWLGGEPPRACDGRSLRPLVLDMLPADWRTELHYEYDFRDTFHSRAETELGLHMDECTLLVVQDAKWKYVHFTTLPPLLFDLEADPGQFTNLADSPDHAAIARDYAQKALSWRMFLADRTLTHYRASPNGLERRIPIANGEKA